MNERTKQITIYFLTFFFVKILQVTKLLTTAISPCGIVEIRGFWHLRLNYHQSQGSLIIIIIVFNMNRTGFGNGQNLCDSIICYYINSCLLFFAGRDPGWPYGYA